MRFNLEIAIRSDFADLFEVKSGEHRAARPHHHRLVRSRGASLRTAMATRTSTARSIVPACAMATSRPVYANGRMSFDVDMEPGGSWHACLLYDCSATESGATSAPEHCIDDGGRLPARPGSSTAGGTRC